MDLIAKEYQFQNNPGTNSIVVHYDNKIVKDETLRIICEVLNSDLELTENIDYRIKKRILQTLKNLGKRA